MTEPGRPTGGQHLAAEQLDSLAAASDDAIEVLAGPTPFGLTGWVSFEVSLDLHGLAHAVGGITVRPRERFYLDVPPQFPFKPPSVRASHARWSGTPHVQWATTLCLYAAPSVQWQPGDGMRGLLDQLRRWLERAAVGDLDPDALPLHPPVAYAGGTERIVVRADVGNRAPWATAPPASAASLVALCADRGDGRLDVEAWLPLDDYRRAVSSDDPPRAASGTPLTAAAGVFVDSALGFEYPNNARDLSDALQSAGFSRDDLLDMISVVAHGNARTTTARREASGAPESDKPDPVTVIVGTPSRRMVAGGPRLAHLVAWRLDELGTSVADLRGDITGRDPGVYGDLQRRVRELGERWLTLGVPAQWVRVLEDRPEVTVRRDAGSSLEWVRSKTVLVFGCGALGAPIAEACVRAGAARVNLVDDGTVTPGILVRQPYADEDIGEPKAMALARRLAAIRNDCAVLPEPADAITSYLQPGRGTGRFDVIIDATADASVRAAMEFARASDQDPWPPVITVLIGHDARRGVVTICKGDATGAGLDALRRFGLAARTTHSDELADMADDLYPARPRDEPFLPEPGCSAPTFVGSHAEVTALAATMLVAAMDVLIEHSAAAMTAVAVRLGGRQQTRLQWPQDVVVPTADGTHQVRISEQAMHTMRAEARRGARIRGPLIETGGTLLGQIDDAARVVFIDAATPPPPDSRLSAVHFEHGVVGVAETVAHHHRRTGGVTGFLGMWHTHPCGAAHPSPTDKAGMASLVTPVADGPPRALLLIAGGDDEVWRGWLAAADGSDSPTVGPDIYARLVRRREESAAVPVAPPAGNYFPGGWCTPPSTPADMPWWQFWRRVRG